MTRSNYIYIYIYHIYRILKERLKSRESELVELKSSRIQEREEFLQKIHMLETERIRLSTTNSLLDKKLENQEAEKSRSESHYMGLMEKANQKLYEKESELRLQLVETENTLKEVKDEALRKEMGLEKDKALSNQEINFLEKRVGDMGNDNQILQNDIKTLGNKLNNREKDINEFIEEIREKDRIILGLKNNKEETKESQTKNAVQNNRIFKEEISKISEDNKTMLMDVLTAVNSIIYIYIYIIEGFSELKSENLTVGQINQVDIDIYIYIYSNYQ